MNELIIGDLVIKTPIIQGGMGVCISLSGLASSVANEGGVGVISAVGIGMLEDSYEKNFKESNKIALRKEIEKGRKLTNGILGVNIMHVASDFDDLLHIALQSSIDIVFVGAGLFLKKPVNIPFDFFKYSKTKFIPKVSSVKAVNIIFKFWDKKYNKVPDAVVLEGPLSGGHQGFKREELENINWNFHGAILKTKKIIEPYEQKYGLKIPVIAAGGIFDGSDIFNAIHSGADGVKIGTRFITTNECDAAHKFKQCHLLCEKKDMVIIDSPVGLPARVIRNNFVKKILNGEVKPFHCPWKCLKTCNFKEVSFCMAKALFNSAQGKLEEGLVFGSTKAYKANKIQTVKETIQELKEEYYHEAMVLQ